MALGHDGERFLRLIDEATAPLKEVVLPETDAVHGDLESGNILLAPAHEAERAIAVIDIDACGAGTRAIDHAWLVRDAVTHGAPASSTDDMDVLRALRFRDYGEHRVFPVYGWQPAQA